MRRRSLTEQHMRRAIATYQKARIAPRPPTPNVVRLASSPAVRSGIHHGGGAGGALGGGGGGSDGGGGGGDGGSGGQQAGAVPVSRTASISS